MPGAIDCRWDVVDATFSKRAVRKPRCRNRVSYSARGKSDIGVLSSYELVPDYHRALAQMLATPQLQHPIAPT